MKQIHILLFLIFKFNLCHPDTKAKIVIEYAISNLPTQTQYLECNEAILQNQQIFNCDPMFPYLFAQLKKSGTYNKEQISSVIQTYFLHGNCSCNINRFLKDLLPISHEIVYDEETTYFDVEDTKDSHKICAYVTPKFFIWHSEQKNFNENSAALLIHKTVYTFQACYGNNNTFKANNLTHKPLRINFEIHKISYGQTNLIVYIYSNEYEVKIPLHIDGHISLDMLKRLFWELHNTFDYGSKRQCFNEHSSEIVSIISKYIISSDLQIIEQGKIICEMNTDEKQTANKVIEELSQALIKKTIEDQNEQNIKDLIEATRPWYARLFKYFRPKEAS